MKRDTGSILVKPHITERSSLLVLDNVYSFRVSDHATKSDVARAVFSQYKVKPLSVRMVRLPGKRVARGRTMGRSKSFKKAYVKVPKGSKIEFV